MRIISGVFKSQKIKQVPLDTTRETSDMVRGACFNVLHDIHDKMVLDLFAGSGAYALEALSRGAKHAYIIDHNKTAIKIINENVNHLKIKDKTTIIYQDALTFLKGNHVTFDLVFLDPPYERQIDDILAVLAVNLSKNGAIVYEHEHPFVFRKQSLSSQ